jgi:predicted metal-dependent hydrolase
VTDHPYPYRDAHRHQLAVLDLVGDWSQRHDQPALAALSPAARAAQLAARRALWESLNAIWEAPRRHGESPADLPDYDAVAALRELFAELVAAAEQARHAAADPDGD